MRGNASKNQKKQAKHESSQISLWTKDFFIKLKAHPGQQVTADCPGGFLRERSASTLTARSQFRRLYGLSDAADEKS